MLKTYITRIETFLRNHLLGIAVFAVITGVLGNFVYDAVKPKESAPPPAAPTVTVDPQISAQAMRTSASSLRAIAATHMRSPLPIKWQEAERLFTRGMGQYEGAEYRGAYQSFKSSYLIYSDLYEQAKVEGH